MVFTDSDGYDDVDADVSDIKFAKDDQPKARGSHFAEKRRPASMLSREDSIVASTASVDPGPPRKREPPPVGDPEKVQWSDDESQNNGEVAYKKFKARSGLARSKAQKSARRARAIDAKHNPPPKPRLPAGAADVRKQPVKKQQTKESTSGDSSSDGDLMEWTIPDYLQDRRALFDKRREKLMQGGLQLPPTYESVFFSDNERLRHLKERPHFPQGKTYHPYKDIELPYSLGLIPAPIAQFLRDYQVQGAAFLHELFVYQKGGILGDDMGLGKTIQVIAFLTAAYGKTGDERDKKRLRKMRNKGHWYPRTLIICPGSLMANWQDEFRRWGWWHVDVFHGDSKQKEEALSQATAGMLEVLITTYDTYRQRSSEINMVSWDCVVADECHKVKERKTSTTKVMNEVNALCRIGLTGTAIQNKYEELWTLLNWTNPGRFGPVSTWRTSICEPLKMGQSHNASNYQLARARKTAKMLVQNLLPQFFLRRMKALIKDQLPKKSDRVVFCPLTPTQATAYQNFLNSEAVQFIKNSSELCDCGGGKKAGWCCHMHLEDDTKWQAWVFPAIIQLQKLSNHLAILIPQGSDPPEKQAKDLKMLRLAMPNDWSGLYESRDSIMHTGNPEFCGKWRVLKKLLKFWHDEGGNKILVFSHSVRLLRMLQNLFISTSYNVKYLDGSMRYEDRYAAVQDFNADPTQFVFLISTKAGGVGLNITSANKVVVVDPNWNPSYDLQAQDRAYRIGQTRDVEVFRLVSQGTLEEIVYARQIYKQQQASIGYNASSERRYFKGVQDRRDQKGEIFGLQNLFAYQNENVVLRDIVNKLNVAESKADVRVANLELEDEDEADFRSDDDDTNNNNDTTRQTSFKSDPESEDAMMSQLAAEITGDNDQFKSRTRLRSKTSFAHSVVESKKHDPIQAILSSVGVSYTHENSEVIGSSRVEAQLSRRAERAADRNGGREGERSWDLQVQETRVFLEESENQEHGQVPSRWERESDMDIVANDGTIRYRYRPPEDVKRRQFGSMARWAGYGDDIVEFALVVESWTQAQRRECLEKFYRWRKDVLEGLAQVDTNDEVDEVESVAGLKKEHSTKEIKVESQEEDDEL